MTDLWLPSDEEIALLSDEELGQVLEALDVARRAEADEWHPQPKQALATYLAGQATETLFGGAAGGGKSEWLLHYALGQMLAHPYNRGGIFRRVYPSLERTLIGRTKQFYPQHGGTWHGVHHTWTFPNGSVLEMGSLPHADSVYEHQGTEYGFLGFEEVTEFLESQVTYLIGRLRAPAPGVRPHMVATANPGGKGHRWVKRRWVKPKEGDWPEGQERPVAFRPWVPRPTVRNPNPTSRVFVPSTLADNPALLRRDPEYVNRVRANSDRRLALAMETGDWDVIDAIEGALWQQSWFDEWRRPEGWERRQPSVHRVVAVDPSDGNEDGDSFGVWAGYKGADGVGYTQFSDGWKASPRKMAERAIALYHQLSADEIVVERNHGGKWVKEVLLGVDRYANVTEVWASDGKITRARPVAALFEPDETRDPPVRARMIGEWEELEEQCTSYTGQTGKEPSPNELDAMVWGLTRLMLGKRAAGDRGGWSDERNEGRR